MLSITGRGNSVWGNSEVLVLSNTGTWALPLTKSVRRHRVTNNPRSRRTVLVGGGAAHQASGFRARGKGGESFIPLYKENDTPKLRKPSANLIYQGDQLVFLLWGSSTTPHDFTLFSNIGLSFSPEGTETLLLSLTVPFYLVLKQVFKRYCHTDYPKQKLHLIS